MLRRISATIMALLPLISSIQAQEQPNSGLSSPSSILHSLTQLRNDRRMRASSTNKDLNKNADSRPIEAGETLVMADLEGPGVITHIWNTIGTTDPFAANSLVLRIYWDGAEKPSVQVPLGDFFGVGHAAAESFSSLPVSTSSYGRSRNCYWHMPFRNRAKITMTNESKEHRCRSFYYYIDWQKLPSLPENTAYFHAQYRQAMPPGPGRYTVLETKGHGHYIGTVYSAHQTKVGWFGEGDDFFYIDGEKVPSLTGTGTEDYFGDAWGFRKFSQPFHGVSCFEGYFPGDRVTAYRWHLTDPITFHKSLKFEIEHRGSIFSETTGMQTHLFVERPDWIRSTAFWYQWPPVEFPDGLPPHEKRLAPYRVLKASELKHTANPRFVVAPGDPGVTYIPRKEDAELSFEFELEEGGTYQINATMSYFSYGSRYKPFLDDKPLGPELDFCREGADTLWTNFDLHKLEKGKHTLKFVGRGPSPNRRSLMPTFNAMGMEYLILLRLEDMKGYLDPIPR